MQEPTVSVIVTTYNREELLKETIQSILNQTFTDFELIVVDNFSNYDFYKVIEEFGDARIKPFQNANNGIIAVNRNYGISKAKGKYLAFCDDDDLWMPEKLDVQIDVIKKDPYQIVATYLDLIDCNSNVTGYRDFPQYKNIFLLCIYNRLSLSSVFVLKTDEVWFDESSVLVGIEDYNLWLNLIHKDYGITIVEKRLVKYRIGNQNYSNKDKKLPIRRISLVWNVFKTNKNASLYYLIRAIVYNIRVYIQYCLFK